MTAVVLIAIGAGLWVWYRNTPREHTMTGKLTTKFTDCAREEQMNAQGFITTKTREITCDGGSYIVIDYRDRIGTSSGMIADPNRGYSADVSGVEVGDTVRVHYVADSDGYMTLDCQKCGVVRVQ